MDIGHTYCLTIYTMSSVRRQGVDYIHCGSDPSYFQVAPEPETRLDTRGRAEDHKQSMAVAGVMNAPLYIYHYRLRSLSL